MREFRRIGDIPWDMLVFLLMTTVGFAVAVHRISTQPTSENRILTELVAKSGVEEGAIGVQESDEETLLDLGCVGTHATLHEKIPKNQGSIRVKGRFCSYPPTARGLAAVQIVNASTGYKGTVILRGADNSFVSDYLVLRRGKNLIQLEWSDSKSAPPRMAQAELSDE